MLSLMIYAGCEGIAIIAEIALVPCPHESPKEGVIEIQILCKSFQYKTPYL